MKVSLKIKGVIGDVSIEKRTSGNYVVAGYIGNQFKCEVFNLGELPQALELFSDLVNQQAVEVEKVG